MQINVPGVDRETSGLTASMAWVSQRPGWKHSGQTATNGRLEFRRSLGVWSLSRTENGIHFQEVIQDPTRLQIALFEMIFPARESDDAD